MDTATESAAPAAPVTALVRRSPFEQVREVAAYMADLDAVAGSLCKSTILPKEMQHPANLKLVLAQGISMGFDIWQSIRASFIIPPKKEGEVPKVGYYVDSLVALVRTRGVCRFFRVEESTAKRCRVVCARTDEPESMVHTFELTIEQARESGLDKKWYFDRNTREWVSEVKANWQTNPADMLNARCCGRACKRVFQDVVYGMTTPDEIDDFEAADSARRPAFVSVPINQSMPSAAPGTPPASPGAAPPASSPIVEAELVDEPGVRTETAPEVDTGDTAWDELVVAVSKGLGVPADDVLFPDAMKTAWERAVADKKTRRELNELGPLSGEATRRANKSKACSEVGRHMVIVFNERNKQLREAEAKKEQREGAAS